MAKVKYYNCTQAKYDSLPTKEPGSFYKTEKHLYLGDKLLDQGDLDMLQTTDKSSLVAAINEVVNTQSWVNF